jgi:hypothetical protein
MRASTLLSVIFLCGLCFSQENPSPNKHDEDARTQRGVSTQKPEQQSPQSVPVSSPSSQQGGDKHAQYEHPSEDKVYRVYVVDEPTSAWTKAYVFITAAIGVVGLFSIWILWRQTNIAQQSAQAALLSAQAVIHAERAWVMADLDFRPGSGLTKLLTPMALSAPPQWLRCAFRIAGQRPLGFSSNLSVSELTTS